MRVDDEVTPIIDLARPAGMGVTMMADDSNSIPLNPLLHRKLQRDATKSLVPQLESIATEFVEAIEPLRLAMNTMIEAGPNDWAEVLYHAGPLLPVIEVPPWESTIGGNIALTRKGLLEMVRASKAENRQEFERWQNLLRDDPDTASRLHSEFQDDEKPIGELPSLACHFSTDFVQPSCRKNSTSLSECD